MLCLLCRPQLAAQVVWASSSYCLSSRECIVDKRVSQDTIIDINFNPSTHLVNFNSSWHLTFDGLKWSHFKVTQMSLILSRFCWWKMYSSYFDLRLPRVEKLLQPSESVISFVQTYAVVLCCYLFTSAFFVAHCDQHSANYICYRWSPDRG